jgi:hypothetical protein
LKCALPKSDYSENASVAQLGELFSSALQVLQSQTPP